MDFTYILEVCRFYKHFWQTFCMVYLPPVIRLHDFFMMQFFLDPTPSNLRPCFTCLCLVLPYDLSLGFTENNEAASAVAEGWWWLWGLACLTFMTAALLA